MRVATSYNNFSRGKIDHDMNGRFDLPIYQSGADIFQNMISNFKGNAIYRTGWESLFLFDDCEFVEFKFKAEQNYLLVFYNTKIRFLSYDVNGDFGWVLDGMGDILEVTTPYSLAECRELDYSQNADVMVFVHPSYAPYKLTRVSANSFTFATFSRTADPFTGAGLYPSCVLFYKGRLYYAAPTTKITTVYASKSGSYDDFTLTPVDEASALIFTIADISQKIEWLFGGDNSLIAGAGDGIVAVNGGGVGNPITAETVEASLTSAEGCNSTYPLRKDGLVFYVSRDGRNMLYFSYDLLTESFIAKDANFISYDITEGGMGKIRHKKDRNDLIFSVRGDGELLTLNFKLDENVIGWHDQVTDGTFKDIGVISDNTGAPQVFALVLRGSSYYIERQGPYIEFSERSEFFIDEETEAEDDDAYIRKVSEELKSCIYLDNSQTVSNLKSNQITYTPITDNTGTITALSAVFSSGDVGKHIVYKTESGYESGRFEITGYSSTTSVSVTILQEYTSLVYTDWYLTFSTISGLSQYNGRTVGVVTDGGYLDDFLVSGGEIDLGSQVTHAVVGFKYKGTVKSFCLGFQVKADNTQVTMKAIYQASLRFVSTAGGKFGSSPYRLEAVQELGQNDINYLPPIPIDGTKAVTYTDDNEKDKYFYLVQDEPLPMTATAVILDTKYAVQK